MTKEEYLKILKDSFKDFVFYEDGHYYECKGKRVGISVTTFIHEFCNESLHVILKSHLSFHRNMPENFDITFP